MLIYEIATCHLKVVGEKSHTFLSFLITASVPGKGKDPFPLGNLTFLPSANSRNITSCSIFSHKKYICAQNNMYLSGRRIKTSQKSRG